MSTYEKLGLAIISILLLFMVIVSFKELKEPPELGGFINAPSRFDQSIGKDFMIGPFTTLVSQHSSSELEKNCDVLQPVILATLHDVKEHLEIQARLASPNTPEYAFEVNEQTLALFCHTTADITLSGSSGVQLLLQKTPFARSVPPGREAGDVGTLVRINATRIPAGGSTPAQPTTYGEILIPDRFLDATSSANN